MDSKKPIYSCLRRFRYLLLILIFLTNCKHLALLGHVVEKKVDFNFKGSPFNYTHFLSGGTEYVSFLDENKIYIYTLESNQFKDSIEINYLTDKTHKRQYGNITSFCFNGRDSLFILFDNALIFLNNKSLKKTILINKLGSKDLYEHIYFTNLDKTPIYFDNKTQEIIGRIYCHDCGQLSQEFYRQPQLSGINLNTEKLSIYNISFSEMYKENYYGFSNEVTINSYDSVSLMSFSVDPNIYKYNRYRHSLSVFDARISEMEPLPLDTNLAKSTEEKIKRLTENPFYTSILYDKYKKRYYRFMHKEISLKNDNGTYNTYENKQLLLAVYDDDFNVLGVFTLDKHYREFVSFVTKVGLYIYFSDKSTRNNNGGYFKILNFNK